MDSRREWFGEDFGQKIDLTVRIREILRNYPEGTSILKELVQNADDAGAREVRLCLDHRQHGTTGLPSPSLEQFQGPALLVYNDGVFTETDFRSIQRIGDSLKKDTSKGGKTGRFGIGFNSVYHLTELPAFVSSEKWCSFDPQAKFLPNVNPANPGKMVDFVQHPETVRRYPDQFSPLIAFGSDMRSKFEATLFRFPLRTAEQASASRLSRQSHSTEDIQTLLQAFSKESAGMLLFLKNVERMRVFEWHPGQDHPQQTHDTYVPSPSAALRRSRAFALQATPERLAGGRSTHVDYVMTIVSQPSVGSDPAVRETWQVCNQLGGPRATAIAASEQSKHMRLVPWAGVAARLSTTAPSPTSEATAEGGRVVGKRPPPPRGAAYCFLPLPVVTGLPVHVNGYFELSSNRRDIWHGDDMAGDGELRANWNKALVEDLAASCYSRVLIAAKAITGGGDAYEELWPTGQTVARSMWRGLADSLMHLVKPLPLLETRAQLGGGWVAPRVCVVWAAHGVADSGEEDEHDQRALAEIFLAEKVPLVEGGRELRALLLSSGCAQESSTPAYVRRLFKSLAARSLASAGPNGTVSLQSGNPDARKNCLLLLCYCLADIGVAPGRGRTRGAARGKTNGSLGYKELAGLPLVPLADGSHGVFKCFAAVDASKLELLRRMGFTEAQSRQALLKHREVHAAVVWLSSGAGRDADDAGGGEGGEGRPFVLCTDEEASLLSRAGSSLISEATLSASSRNTESLSTDGAREKVGVRGRDRAGETAAPIPADDTDGSDRVGSGNERVLRALRSPSLQSALNVTSMRDELLPDLVGQTLPEEWRGGGTATEFRWTPGRGGHPPLEWFRRLWGYLATRRSSAVRLLAESFPVLPTGEGVVCPLSLRSAVIEGGRLGGELRSILIMAGCRTLLPGVFAGDAEASVASVSTEGHGEDKTTAKFEAEANASTSPPPPRELFEYVRPGTREGVLAALGTARRSAGKPLKDLMRAATSKERDALREFLAREPASEMSSVEVAVCRELPVLPLHGDGLTTARSLSESLARKGASGAKMAKAATKGAAAGLVGGPTNGSSSAPAAPADSAYAAAESGPLYLLLESCSEFVAVKGSIGTGGGDGANPDLGAPAASPKWLEVHLLTPSFINIKMGGNGSGAGGSSAAEVALAERLGARLIRRATFFVEHVFPMLRQLPDGLRDAAMVEALLAAPRLSQQHELFRSTLAALEFVPCGAGLVRPCDVFDPEVPELPALLPESRFPEGVFRIPDVLVTLRPLGLQSTLGWSGLVEAAASVEPMLRGWGDTERAVRVDDGNGSRKAAAAAARGRALLTYLDTHEVRLFDLKRETTGLLQRMAKLVLADPAAAAREKERLAAIQHLMSLQWVPVLTAFPSQLVPVTIENGIIRPGGNASTPREKTVVVSPSRVRPREDMWVSSRTFFVLDAEVRSAAVQEAFSWNTSIDPVVVARQVTGLAETFSQAREAPEQGVENAFSPEQNAHTLEGHRQTMAAVVPRLYQLLSNAIEAHDRRRQGQGVGDTGAGEGSTMVEGVRAVLHEAPWLWVGDGFVPADQVAFTSPANAAPYLYAVPPDLACFATLLKRFGVRPSFGPSDFCHALRRLAVETGAAEPVVTPSAISSSSSGGQSRVGGGSGGTVRGMFEGLAARGGVEEARRSGKRVRTPRQLTPAEVELVVAMVQVLSDESIRVSDLEIWVPDASSVLALSSDLLYDDAPWLTKQGHLPAAVSRGKPTRFVHPKVSMAVGEKLGVGSLRRSMVSQNLARLDFDLKVPGESFGQQESLTRRLKHILQMYPEGPSILSELVQNADDAGARTVRVMLNTNQYGDGSLLSPGMSNWQGPSLYVFNDAVFTDRDFQNLARIGQASKLDRLSATGRFGLGFNSVYHFTDIPSFVSGDHVVMFDPHTKYVPGATSVQPGIKIRFAETDLLEQFPDQFSPYLFFGCELKNRFDGTLFRFPLRVADVARASEISHASYSPDAVVELLNQFKEAAHRYLLFLRHVQRIEVYTFKSADPAPVLWYSVGVTKRNPRDGWLTVPHFVSGHPRRPISKEAFYNKLSQTPDSALPKVDQLVTITFRQEAERVKRVGAGLGGPAAALLHSVTAPTAAGAAVGGIQKEDESVDVGGSSESESELVEVGDVDTEGEGGGAATKTAVASDEGRRATSIVDVFLVCVAIGGGQAKALACRPEGRAMKFIPWGGVAAHVSRNSQPPLAFKGQAFCFLPLPVTTLLPVHVNGFFELSTNRRDIWFGEDMAGAGKRRSEWNAILLRDVIAPIYASLVVKARDVMGPGPQHQALLPIAEMSKAWENVVTATYAHLKNAPVLFSRQSVRGEQGRWIAPGKAIVVDEEEDGGIGGEERVEYAKRLGKILLWDGLPVVRIPTSLKKAMLQHNCLGADATPPFLRAHFRKTDVAHPCLALEAGGRRYLPPSAPGRNGGAVAIAGSDWDARLRPPAKQIDARSNALFLLQASAAGLKADVFGELVGLPLLPLADGTLGRFGGREERPIFLCSPAERRLLAGEGLGGAGGGAGDRLLEDVDGLNQKTRELLTEKRVHAATNLSVMEPRDLAGMLDAVFPQAWKGLTQVAWAPGSRDVRPKQPSEDWVSCLWDYICTSSSISHGGAISKSGRGGFGAVLGDQRRAEHKDTAEAVIKLFERAWPLLPATGGVGSDAIRVLLELRPGMPVVSPLAEGMRARSMSDDMKKILSKLGVWVLDAKALRNHARNPLVLCYANPCKPSGLLAALQQALFPSARTPRPEDGGVIDPIAVSESPASLDFGPGGRARRWIDNRFQSVDTAGRDALRKFFSDRGSFGTVSEQQLDLLRALPIYRVHGGGNGVPKVDADRRRRAAAAAVSTAAADFTSISGSETALLLAPRTADPALLGSEFVVEDSERDTELLESLGVKRVGRGAFFREHVLPKVVGHSLPAERLFDAHSSLCVNLKLRYSAPEAACREAIVSTLSNLQELCVEDKDLEEALRFAEIVPDGAGEPARISDLFDPAVVELPGLLAPEAFPAPEFCKPAALAGMRTLGLKNSLTCEGILQSALSIEAAFAPPRAALSTGSLARSEAASSASDAATAAQAREAAINRSRKLLDFVDHRAEQLLLASGDSGRWFVERRAASGGSDNSGGPKGTEDGDEVRPAGPQALSVSSESESEEDTDGADLEDLEEGREERAEHRERKKEKRERQRARTEAAKAASRKPPPNAFVEELTRIAWLPVHSKAPNDLLPWKARRPNARQESAKVAAPYLTRPESDQWFCSLRLGVLEGDVKSRALKKAFGWDRPLPGLVLAVQLLALSKKFEKLTVLSQKAEMKRKLAVVTQDMYNNLDLLVGSSEFIQVKSTLMDREWLWLGDKFVSSERIAFEVPSAAIPPLSTVPTELSSYSTLLTALGVREKFAAADFVAVLRSIHTHFRGRALDQRNLDLAVGLVKTLANLSLAERASIQSEVVLVPDRSGPTLFPAASLVYDDAPWLSSRLKHMNLRLVHQDIGDEMAKAVGVRGLREYFLSNQGGTQNLPCPIAREVGLLLNLSHENCHHAVVGGSTSSVGNGEAGNQRAKRQREGVGNRWLHDVMDVAEAVKARDIDIVLDQNGYQQQSLLHPALADAQGPAVCVVMPHVQVSEKELTKLLAPPTPPFGGDASEGMGRPRIGNGVTALFALTDCLQVLSGDSLCLFDPCGEYLFTGEKQARNPPQASGPRGNFERASQAAGVFTGGGAGVSGASPIRGNSRARRTSLSASSSSPSTPRTPSPSLRNASSTPRPRSAFPSSSPSSSRRSAAQARCTVTVYGGASPSGTSLSNATGGADRVSGGGVSARGGEGQESTGGSPREPLGKRYIVRREDVFNQFPDQYAPFLALPGRLGQAIREGLTSGRGYSGTVFRMSLRTRPSEISGSKCSMDAVERELLRFAENASAGLVMAHSLERVGALVLRKDAHGTEELFTSVCSSPIGRRKELIAEGEWRKNGLNVFIRGFSAPRGKYKVTLRTSRQVVGRVDGEGVPGREGDDASRDGEGVGAKAIVTRHEEVEDHWMVSYVLAPPAARALALKGDFAGHNLTPLLTCASLVSRNVVTNHNERSARELPVVWGRLFVGQDTSVRTGLPFHVDGPFFVEKRTNSRKAFLVLGKGDDNGKPLRRFPGVATADWNKDLFVSLCTDLVPEHMVDLKDDLAGNDAAMLYRFWPSAKRAKEPFSIMLPGQMYQRLGELPLYLSRSALDGGFKTMKEGYFKTQAVSPLVEEYIRRHVNLFSVPHMVTEDLARQPGVTVDKISPASVRQFLRRSKGDIARNAVADFFGNNNSGNAATGVPHDPRQNGMGARRERPPDTDLLLELLEFCLSDCPPPGERPPGVSVGRGGKRVASPASGVGQAGNRASAGAAAQEHRPAGQAVARAVARAAAAEAEATADGRAGGENDGEGAVNLEEITRISKEAEEARKAVAQWETRLRSSKEVWKQLHGVPLLLLANGRAGAFGTSLASRGGQRHIVANRRQQGLIKQLSSRFVHLKAIRRLEKFFDCDEFLKMMGMVRFTPSILAENLHLVLPRAWKGEKFVDWRGGQPQPPSGAQPQAASGVHHDISSSTIGNDVPRAGWLALFWTEVPLLDAAAVQGLDQWPLLPITTGELASCSILQQVVRACPSMLNEVKHRGLAVSLATVRRTETAADERDKKELQEVLAARQASEANTPGRGEEEQDNDLQELKDDEEREDEEKEGQEDEEKEEQDGQDEGHDHDQKAEGEGLEQVETAGRVQGDHDEDGGGGGEVGDPGAGNDSRAVEVVGNTTASSFSSDGGATDPARSSVRDGNSSGRYLGGGVASASMATGEFAFSITRSRSVAEITPVRSRTPPLIPPPQPAPQSRRDQRRSGGPAAGRSPPMLSLGVGAAAMAVIAGAMGVAPSPEAAGASAAGAASLGPVPEPARLKGLVSVLRRLGVPVLELAFFPEEQRPNLVVRDPAEAARGALHAIYALRNTQAPQYPISEACEARRLAAGGEAGEAIKALIASGEDHARDSFGRRLRLRWAALESADMDALVQGLSKPSDLGAPIAFPASELDKLRQLPVWKTLSGKRVRIVRQRHFSLQEGADIAGLPLPPGASDRLLAPSTELSDLIRDIGVEQVTHPQVVARFILPELWAVAPEDRRRLLQHVREHWATLKQEQAVVDTLKQSAFVPVKGVPTKANQLFDPRNEVLKEIFCDEPDAFPTGEFAEAGWLDVLVDVGLKNKLDRDTILQCARKVEYQRADPLPSEVQNRACILMRHINSEAGGGELYNNEFLSKLSRLRFVPVNLPPPLHRADNEGIGAGGRGDDLGASGVGGGGGGADEGWSPRVVLVRFEEAAVPKDRNLVFTAFPVHISGLVPNQLFWSLLKIQSPPPLEIVLRHIRIITEKHSQLDRWQYPQTPVKVFQALFEFLEENWSKLSPGVVKALKDKPLVPVGARLIKAARLFFRLKENLSPFMFEVPRAFGAFDSLFKNLGTTQSPTASDYAVFLKELATECGSQALNPNELGAVLKVLSLLAAELEADTSTSLPTDIFVPDERSELVPWGLCLYNDSRSLAGRVDPSRLRCLHPRVSLEDCRRLRIPSVSQVVREDLQLGFQPEPILGEESLQAQLSATLSSDSIGVAVAVLVKQFSPEDASVGIGTGGADVVTFEARANAAASRLKGFSVVFVKQLRSRFLRTGGYLGAEEDITAPGGATGSLFFVKEAGKSILVARGALPETFPPSYAVAMAVSRLIMLPSAAVGPLSVLLATKPDGVEDCLGVLHVRQGAVTGDEMTRGLPGEPLTVGDRSLLELKPLKAFLPGEVIAWEDKQTSVSDSRSNGVMRYGVVIMGGSSEGGEGGGDDDEYAGDGRGSGRVGGGSGLRDVRVKLTPGRVDNLLSSQVYSFRQARAGGDQPQNLVAHAAKMFRHISGGHKRGVEESKVGLKGLVDHPRGGGQGAISSTQLLEAVNDILGRADLSLSVEQGETLEQSLKHKDEARAAQAALAKATAEKDQLERRLKRLDKAFVCTICCTNDVNVILAPCGHMLCSSCMASMSRQSRCPFCRKQWTATAAFRKPGDEDVSDDDDDQDK